MHVFEMTPQISALSEGFLAKGAGERPLTCVLAEVISEVAALFEDALAACVAAFKIQLDALTHQVLDHDSLVPLLGNALESLGLDPLDHGVLVVLRLVAK